MSADTPGADRPRAEAAWTGPALLVPMNVEAIAITDDAYKVDWSFVTPEYRRLDEMLSSDAAPFSSALPSFPGVVGDGEDFRGILLHWSLPDGFTVGADDGARVEFPAVPDRWLVVGRARIADRWRHRAWIVASDVIGPPPGDGRYGGPWPQTGTGPGSARVRTTTLGASWPIESWPGEAALTGHLLDSPLAAVGPGDPGYAAFAPNIPNGFAHADLFTADDDRAGPLSYTVIGWYSRPERDPLYGAEYGSGGWTETKQWHDLTEQLGWSVGDDADLDRAEQAARAWALARGLPVGPGPHLRLPARTLCHGTVQGIAWQGVAGPFVSGVPTGDSNRPGYVRPQVAVAHCGPDALAAIIAETRRQQGMPPDRVARLVDILTAFQLDLLPELDAPDGSARLAAQLQRAWFTEAEGGSGWEVVSPGDTAHPGGDPLPPHLTDAQRELLDALNAAQQELDRSDWSVQSSQWDLFALWWKQSRLPKWQFGPTPEQRAEWTRLIENAMRQLKPELAEALDAHRGLLARCERAEAALKAALAADGLELRQTANPPFQAPSEPVLMISGARRARRHGADGRLSEDGRLRCRFTGQTVSGLTVLVAGRPVPVTGRELPPPAWPVSELPRETSDLLLEAAMLDLDEAPLIATVAAAEAGWPDPWSLLAAIRVEQSLIWNPTLHPELDARAVHDASALIYDPGPGAPPSRIAVTLHEPPWAPLYLDWGFDYFPGTELQSEVLRPWELPDRWSDPLDEFAYTWRGPEPPVLKNGQWITGRTPLTPQATELLAARLERTIAEYGDTPDMADHLWALTDVLTYLREADLLSQAAGGFNAALLELAEETFPAPADGELARYLDPPGGPVLRPSVPPNPPTPPRTPAPNRFQPIRGGHAVLRRLWVVDAFGQILKLIDPGGGVLRGYAPIRGNDLHTRGAKDLAELKPRVAQPSRMTFRLVPGGAGAAAGVAAGAAAGDESPVCGWIAASPLERGVIVYAADGQLEGFVLDADLKAVWAGAPERTVPAHGAPSPDSIANPHLRALICGLLANPDSAGALRALLDLIDTAALGTDPAGGWTDEELPELIGAPLCVVRAKLEYSLRGRPAQDQAWGVTGSGSTAGFDAVRFPVQLGCTELLDDGLVGYFLNDDYSRINTSYPVRENGYIGSERPTVSLDGSAAPVLTLVTSPLTAVHAISGLLPPARIEIPTRFTLPALERIDVMLRTGPVLTGRGEVAMPLPEVSQGTWSWLEYQDPHHVAVERPVAGAEPVAGSPDVPPVIREGWLRLSSQSSKTDSGTGCAFAYSMSPSTLATTADAARPSVAALQLTAYNGSDAPVDCRALGFRLPIGPGPGDLTDDPGRLVVVPPGQGTWTVERDGPDRFTARPVAPPFRVGPGGTLVFGFREVLVNAVEGRAAVEISESAGALTSGSVAITKVQPLATTELVYTITPREIPPETELDAAQPDAAQRDVVLFRITAFNAGRQPLHCAQISLTVPIGDGPGDLVREPGQVGAAIVEGAGWTVEPDGGGGFVLRPGEQLAPGGRLVVALRAEAPVRVPGTVILPILETAPEQAANRATVLTIRKTG